jgi:hypothetical protein
VSMTLTALGGAINQPQNALSGGLPLPDPSDNEPEVVVSNPHVLLHPLQRNIAAVVEVVVT